MNKHISVAIIIQVDITRDQHNKTYLTDKDFLKDKDKILSIVSNDINIDIYDIRITNNAIILNLNEEILNEEIYSLASELRNHPFCMFYSTFNLLEDFLIGKVEKEKLNFKINSKKDEMKKENNYIVIDNEGVEEVHYSFLDMDCCEYYSNIFRMEYYEALDKDPNSSHYPIAFDISLMEFWVDAKKYTRDTPINMLELLSAYGKEFYKYIKISSALVYAIIK